MTIDDSAQSVPVVILHSFGGPETEGEVRPFLKRLFEDPFMIGIPWDSVRSLLAEFIVRRRIRTSLAAYRQINFSPANAIAKKQASLLELKMREMYRRTKVLLVNRYCEPFASDVVRQLSAQTLKLFVLPMYPHYCHSTTASSFWDWDTAVRAKYGDDAPSTVRVFSWWQNESYLQYSVDRLKKVIRRLVAETSERKVTILFSAHGVPQRQVLRGDPYACEINSDYREIKHRAASWLKSEFGEQWASRFQFQLSFQSRATPFKWLEPSTEDSIRKFGETHGGVLVMFPLSFVYDQIETLHEVDGLYRTAALNSGFSHFYRVEMPNDDERFIDCLKDVLIQHGFKGRANG